MPMPALLASGNIASINGSGVSAGTPTRLITTTYLAKTGSNLHIEGGLYGLYWNLVCTSAATGAASAQVPLFTWYDDVAAATVTSTGGAYGSLMDGKVSAAIALTSGATVYGLSAMQGCNLRGCEFFQAGSGASGASAYIQVSCAATNPIVASPAVYRFYYRIFRVDDWGV